MAGFAAAIDRVFGWTLHWGRSSERIATMQIVAHRNNGCDEKWRLSARSQQVVVNATSLIYSIFLAQIFLD